MAEYLAALIPITFRVSEKYPETYDFKKQELH